MSLYLGKATDNLPLLHITTGVTEEAVIKTGVNLATTVFNSRNPLMYVTSIENVSSVNVSTNAYNAVLQWSGTNTGTQFFYIVNTIPLTSPEARLVVPTINPPGLGLFYNSFGASQSPKSFRFSSQGFLQFHSGYGDTSFSVDYAPWNYVRTDVTVQRVNYAYFSNNGSDIEMNSNLFRLGSLNMKNIILLSVTSSPNAFDYKISIPGTTKYVQFLNKFSVDNNLGGLVLKEDGVYSNVTGGLTPLLTKYSAITTKYTNS
jgi:hypothetical protein